MSALARTRYVRRWAIDAFLAGWEAAAAIDRKDIRSSLPVKT